MRTVSKALALVIILLLPAGCGRPVEPASAIAAAPGPDSVRPTQPAPTPTPATHVTFAPSPTPAGWQTIADGVQARRMIGYEDGRSDEVFTLRLDPARIDIRLRFDPEQPRRVSDWLAAEQSLGSGGGALRPIAALNAGFFDSENQPVGRWVIEGQTFGRAHRRMQGEFRVSSAGASIRPLRERSLNDGTRTVASVEAYPLLLMRGGVINPCLLDVDILTGRFLNACANISSRADRLIVGIDGAGYVIFLLSPSEVFSLSGLADWLKRSDLNLTIALNLDGGGSAGMLALAGDAMWGADSDREVPGALIVLPKSPRPGNGEPP